MTETKIDNSVSYLDIVTNPTCRNCHSIRRRVYRSGFCGKCFTPARKLANIQGWDLENVETLSDYPSGAFWRTHEYFEIFKTQFTSQARGRLDWLRSREEMWMSGASSMLIERQLRSLSLHAGCRREVHYGSAGRIDQSFDDASKKELFRLLYEIEEERRWEGLNINLAIHRHDRLREMLQKAVL